MGSILGRFGHFETVFVLFFLSMDLGQSLLAFTFDGLFMLATVMLVAALPFFFESSEEVSFTNWILGRLALVGFGVLLGIGYSSALGTVIPSLFASVPLLLAAIAGIVSCVLMYRDVTFVRYAER